MSNYDVNIKRLALLMLPTFMRKKGIASLTYSSVSGLAYVNKLFSEFRNEVEYELTHNFQTCYLRALLNDYYDQLDRRITITEEQARYGSAFIYNRSVNDNEPVTMRGVGEGMLINRRGFSGINSLDFWINIPGELRGEIDEARLRAIVNRFKLASKRFGINYV